MLRVSEPDLGPLERASLIRAFDSTMISGAGEFVSEAEGHLRSLTSSPHALVTCNGTASLHLALMALGIGQGDEVIVPSFTYIASVNAILYVGAEPVFVDIDEISWTLDPDGLEDALTVRTKAIMAVDLYGHPFDHTNVSAFAERHGLSVVEDAAEAHFSSSHGQPVGTLGTISSFSFFGNKVLTCGEGGGVTTGSPELHEKMLLLRNQGMDPNRRFYHPLVGNNFRLNNLSAAVLCAQFNRKEELLSKRRAVFVEYESQLRASEIGLSLRPLHPWAVNTPWLFSVLLPERIVPARGAVMEILLQHNIETRPFFQCVDEMPPYKKFRKASNLQKSRAISKAGINLPTSSLMTPQDVKRVIETLDFAIRQIA